MDMQNQLDEINKVVAVMAYARAASGLWSSLLDGHPNILTTPDCLLMTFYDFWEESDDLTLDDLISAFIDKYNIMFDAREPCKCHGPYRNCGEYLGWTSLGEKRDKFIYVDKEKFRVEMKELLGNQYPVQKKEFFKALQLVYTKSTRNEISRPVFISFGLHHGTPIKVQKLIHDFPDTLFLQPVRNPLSGFGSLLRHYNKSKGLNYKDPFFLMRSMLYDGNIMGGSSDQWRAVRLEDIHTKPQETLEKVCEWLGLPWDDSLLKSTWNGMKWWNEKNTKQVSGFSKKIVDQTYDEYISVFDKFRLSIFLEDKMRVWNYQLKNWHSSIFAKIILFPLIIFPFKVEFIAIKNPQIEGNIIKKSIWLFWKICCTYGSCRLLLLWCWLKLFITKNDNIKLC